MTCVKTGYKDQQTANQVIRRSELSESKRPTQNKVTREAYKCWCGFWHIKKHKTGVTNGFIAETGRFA